MAPQSLSPHDQLAYLTDGIDTLVPEGELLERIVEGRPLRAKLGVDPTAPDVTLGWAVVFDRLRRTHGPEEAGRRWWAAFGATDASAT